MTQQIPLTHGKFAIVDDDDYDTLSNYRWYAHKDRHVYYARANLNGKTIKMHRLVANAPDGMMVDHINGNGLDNRKSNLRICSAAQNVCNARFIRSSTGYRGVKRGHRSDKWEANIKHNGISRHVGTFDTPEIAARAYDKAAQQYHGEFARLNFK